MSYPADRKYTKEHEWIMLENGNTGVVGITNHAQNSLGDIVFVELPKPGAGLTAGSTFGTVESVKAVSDLFAPVSGTVTEVNDSLSATPEKINLDPHGSWMVKVQLSNPADLDKLLSAADYQAFVAEEGGH
jgi:glycine cleavage system H protein